MRERWFDTRFSALEHKGLYISDDALIDHLLKRSNQDHQPLFAYAVTMQGTAPSTGIATGPSSAAAPARIRARRIPSCSTPTTLGWWMPWPPWSGCSRPWTTPAALPGGGLRGPPALPDVGGQGYPRRQTATGMPATRSP